MNEIIEQDSRYPEWMKAWNARTAEIDQQIIDYCKDTTEQTSEAMDEIGQKLRHWWDGQHLDDEAKAQYAKVKADARLFNAQVENRVQHLIQDGKIAWARRARKSA